MSPFHICQGNYAVGPEYDGHIGHCYFDTGRYKADLICKIECDSCLVEYDMAHHYKGLLGNKQLGVGAVDVTDPKVESGELVAERIRKNGWLAPEQTIVTSSCGFNHLSRSVAFGKLQAIAEAKRILLGGPHPEERAESRASRRTNPELAEGSLRPRTKKRS